MYDGAAMLQMPHLDGVEHRHLVVNGVRIHLAEAGEGPPLVLLHGWPQHWWSWRELIGPLARDYRVICPDVRGMGWSDIPRDGYDLRTLAEDVLALLDELGLERVRLAGHDWGFLTGYAVCFLAPQRVERFVPMGGVTPWSAIGAPPVLYLRLGTSPCSRLPPGRSSRTGGAQPPARVAQDGRFSADETEAYMAPLRGRSGGSRRWGATASSCATTSRVSPPLGARATRGAHAPLNGERDPLTRTCRTATAASPPTCASARARQRPSSPRAAGLGARSAARLLR